MVDGSRGQSLEDRRVARRISTLHAQLEAHAAKSAFLESQLNRILNLSQKQDIALPAPKRKMKRNGWGVPPQKPLTLKQQLKQRRQLSLPVVRPSSAAQMRRKQVSPSERRRKAAAARHSALRRLRAKAIATGKGKNLLTTKKDIIRVRSERAKLANLQYGF